MMVNPRGELGLWLCSNGTMPGVDHVIGIAAGCRRVKGHPDIGGLSHDTAAKPVSCHPAFKVCGASLAFPTALGTTPNMGGDGFIRTDGVRTSG